MSESAPRNRYRNAIRRPSDRIILSVHRMEWLEAHHAMKETKQNIGRVAIDSRNYEHGWKMRIAVATDAGSVPAMADAQLHGMPNDVGDEVRTLTTLRAGFITVHATGGSAMLEAAVRGRDDGLAILEKRIGAPVDDRLGGLLALTVPTTMSREECLEIYGKEPEKAVLDLAFVALKSGMDGIVCSGRDLECVGAYTELDRLVKVVAGVRPQGELWEGWAPPRHSDDQVRTVTPVEAILLGADYLQIGAPITHPPEGVTRAVAAQSILSEITAALAVR
ncbi:MAG: pyrF [Candidatus Saccharibacteria bacterium]|nr:pyrF [Candidatus Saccharibacteria bacterium]